MIAFNNVAKIFCSNFDRARSYGFRDIVRGGRRAVPRPSEFFALRGVSLQVQPGESLIVFGTKNSGKTTLAHLICGLFRPDIGRVMVSGRVQCPPKGKLGLNPYMTLREYVELLAAILGVPVTNQNAYHTALLEYCGVKALVDTRMADFPRATLRPLLMAASLLADGDVYVFDDSYLTGSGDFRVRCLDSVAKIVNARTTIILTATPKLPPFSVDHAMILHQGRVLYHGSPQQMLEVFETLVDGLKRAHAEPRALRSTVVGGGTTPDGEVIARMSGPGRAQPGLELPSDGSDGVDPQANVPGGLSVAAAPIADAATNWEERSAPGAVSVMRHLAHKNRTARTAMSPLLADVEVQRLAANDKPILLGPWLGNANWELLYWRPYLAWVLDQLDLDGRRVIAISRAGADPWYRGLSDEYVDLFDLYGLEEFERMDAQRVRVTGMRKQRSMSDIEREMLDTTARNLGLDCFEVIHPTTMFRMYDEVWRGRLPAEFMLQYSRFVRIGPAPPVDLGLPSHYVAVRFSMGRSYAGARSDAHTYVKELIRTIAPTVPVVALDTGYSVEGAEFDLDPSSRVTSMYGRAAPRRSLQLQTQVVAQADAFVGTLGGTVPLAISCGVDTTGLYLEQPGFATVQRTVVKLMSSAMGRNDLEYVDMAEVPARELADRILRARRPRPRFFGTTSQ